MLGILKIEDAHVLKLENAKGPYEAIEGMKLQLLLPKSHSLSTL